MSDQDIIAKLHPLIRLPLAAAIYACNAALKGRAKFVLTSGWRDPAEQERLYAQGRTTPGYIVTNAPPGSSFHEYGLAVDGALILDGKTLSWNFTADFDGDRQADWMECVLIFKEHGFEWGGDWHTFKDMPHFQMTFGYTWRDLKQLRDTGELVNGYVKIPGH